jgi:hypothetical protein
MSHVLFSLLWLIGSICFLYVIFYYFISERKEGTLLIRIMLCFLFVSSMVFFGFGLNYWEHIGMNRLANSGWVLNFFSIFIALSALYNILFSKHSTSEKLGSKSMGPFAYRETYTIRESSPEEARSRGYIKIVCIILFHQVCNIIYLCNVLFG